VHLRACLSLLTNCSPPFCLLWTAHSEELDETVSWVGQAVSVWWRQYNQWHHGMVVGFSSNGLYAVYYTDGDTRLHDVCGRVDVGWLKCIDYPMFCMEIGLQNNATHASGVTWVEEGDIVVQNMEEDNSLDEVIDKEAVPCDGTCSISVFDCLYTSHSILLLLFFWLLMAG